VQYQSWERKEEKERERSKKQGFLGEQENNKKVLFECIKTCMNLKGIVHPFYFFLEKKKIPNFINLILF
jgi:hypothetical protein